MNTQKPKSPSENETQKLHTSETEQFTTPPEVPDPESGDNTVNNPILNTLPILLNSTTPEDTAVIDLVAMKHLLVVGGPGTGKTTVVNRILYSFLRHCCHGKPLKLQLFNPKPEETQMFNSLPQLVGPIIQSPRELVVALNWAIQECDYRSGLLKDAKARSIQEYNASINNDASYIEDPLPELVIVLDGLESCEELPPVGQEIVAYALRKLALADKLGIHLVITGQSCDTQFIKAIAPLIPGRMYCRHGDKARLMQALDFSEEDMRSFPGDFTLRSLLCRFRKEYYELNGDPIPPDELKKVIDEQGERSSEDDDPILLAALGSQIMAMELLSRGKFISTQAISLENSKPGFGNISRNYPIDMNIDKACELVQQNRTGWTSTIELCDRLRVHYDEAAALMEELARRGLVASDQCPFGLRRIVTK